MYERIEELLNREAKGKDYTVIMGEWNDYTVVMGDWIHWNAVVGETREENVVGEYGLGSRNKRAYRS